MTRAFTARIMLLTVLAGCSPDTETSDVPVTPRIVSEDAQYEALLAGGDTDGMLTGEGEGDQLDPAPSRQSSARYD